MRSKTLIGSVVAAMIGALVLSGCASTRQGATGGDDGRDAQGPVGMMCPKCETTWVARVTQQGTKMQRFASERQMTCPDCDAMAKAYLEDGKMVLHNCPTCKVTPMKVSPATPSHPKGTHS